MEILNLVQRSPEWYDVRRSHYTASNLPKAAALSKYITRQAFIRNTALHIEEVGKENDYLFCKGRDAEEKARAIAEEIIDDELLSPTVTDTLEGLPLLASLDGMTMTGNVIWEHKLFSKSLKEQIESGELDEQYRLQMDQQLLLTGADKCLFMASDGTRDQCAWLWYESDAARKENVIATWKAFKQDLEQFEEKAVIQGAEPNQLPELLLTVTGALTCSNMASFRQACLEVIDSIDVYPTTDQEFADAEQTVKWLKTTHENIDKKRDEIINQLPGVNDIFIALEDIKAQFGERRLFLEKALSEKKQSIKKALIAQHEGELKAYVEAVKARHGINTSIDIQPDFASAIKYKKTRKTIENQLYVELQKAKKHVDEVVRRLQHPPQMTENRPTNQRLAETLAFAFSISCDVAVEWLLAFKVDWAKAR